MVVRLALVLGELPLNQDIRATGAVAAADCYALGVRDSGATVNGAASEACEIELTAL